MKSSIQSFLFSVLLLCFSNKAANGMTRFDTKTLAFSGFKFLGDAHVLNDSLRLSRDLLSPNSGAGGIIFRKPIRFRQSVSGIPRSFSTHFSLLITNSNQDCTGGGVAFVISPDDDAIGRSGGYLGIPSGAFAIEFDTQMDVEFDDVNGNHVGLNLGSMVSSNVANLDLFNIDLRSGRTVNVWVDYSGVSRQLNIYVSYTNTKPKLPVLSVSLNLNLYMNEFMYVGLTASTQGSTEIHSVQSWSFRSSSSSKPSRKSPPTTVNSNIPLTQKQSKWDYLLIKIFPWGMVALAVVATGGAWYCIFHLHCCRECNNTSVNCCGF